MNEDLSVTLQFGEWLIRREVRYLESSQMYAFRVNPEDDTYQVEFIPTLKEVFEYWQNNK